jgi:hypothetical protein
MQQKEPQRVTPYPHPDLIASGHTDRSEVLFKMTRRHANILGAYLNQRQDIAKLPKEVSEVLGALTLRLVAPPGRRWADLRRALEGQPVVTTPPPAPVYHRPHRPYDGGPDGEDLRADLRCQTCGSAFRGRVVVPGTELCPDPYHQPPALLGDVDGTIWEEFRNAKPETD